MTVSAKLCLKLYAFALNFYPPAFYVRYADEMLEAARCEAAHSRNLPRLTASLLWDTFLSLPSAHWEYAIPKSPVFVIAILVLYTAFAAYNTLSNQQMCRRSADTVPAMIVDSYSKSFSTPSRTAQRIRELAAQPQQEITSPAWLDGSHAFAVLYDSNGRAFAGDATLNGKLPQPPHGIFDTIRQRGEYRVTWQPQPGVRVALTGRALPSGGFVLAGDSLRYGEAVHAHFVRISLFLWLAVLAILLPQTVARARARKRSLSAT